MKFLKNLKVNYFMPHRIFTYFVSIERSFVKVKRKWRDHWVPLTLLSVNRNIKCKKKRGVL